MTGHAFALAMAALGVNGPEDGRLNWDTVNWRAQEDNVRRLRQRIFKATQDGDWAKVRSLQKLMLRSRANTLTSVRRVTQINAGRMTAGVDGEVALTSTARARLAEQSGKSGLPARGNSTRRLKRSNLYIPTAINGPRTVVARETALLRSPWGLLEPWCEETRSPGSEGAGMQ